MLRLALPCGVALAGVAAAAVLLHPGAAEAAPNPSRAHAKPKATPPPAPAPAPTPVVDPVALMANADNWRQILMAPRVTGNLRAVAIDPSDAKSVYVGTEEGTLAHSSDGGVTWEEVELAPILQQSPSVVTSIYGPIPKTVDVFAGFNIRVGNNYFPLPVMGRRGSDVGPSTRAPPLPELGLPPLFIHPGIGGSIPELVLASTGTRDPKPYEPVSRIRICPGGTNTVYVNTGNKVLAAPDGASFVPVFFARETTAIGDVACSPTNPNEVIVTTGDGTYRSIDGGVSFDQLEGALGPAGSSSVTWGPPGDGGGKAQLYVSGGRDLWIGDPSTADGMKIVNVTGEFSNINHIAATAHSIWLATDTGVRFSKDAGATWTSVDDLEGFDWNMVAVASAGSQEHVAVIRSDIAFDSIDGGAVFRPFFRAQSRRTLRQIVPLPQPNTTAFLLLTSGEVWSTVVSLESPASDPTEDEVRRTSLRRLRTMASLSDTLDRARAKTRMLDVQIDKSSDLLKTRNWLPGVYIGFNIGQVGFAEAKTVSPSTPVTTITTEVTPFYGGGIDLVWQLPETLSPNYQFEPARKDLHKIQKRYLYAVEDAYQERRQVLAQLAAGGLDAEQLLTLQARLEILDVLLQELAGEPRAR